MNRRRLDTAENGYELWDQGVRAAYHEQIVIRHKRSSVNSASFSDIKLAMAAFEAWRTLEIVEQNVKVSA